jgi:hypothetical protein
MRCLAAVATAAVGTALAAGGVLGVGSAAAATAPQDASNIVPSQGLLMGAAAQPRTGTNWTTAFTDLQSSVGAQFALHRDYSKWDSPMPSGPVRDDWAAGRIPALSIMAQTVNGTPVSWASIAAGAQDATIGRDADILRDSGKPVLLTFHHEPENDVAQNGTPADYVAAWRHFVTVFRQHHADNVKFTWILMASSFNGANAQASAFYPGDDYIDWVAADGYNFYGCSGRKNEAWRSFADAFSGFRAWAAQHPTKPILIAETGSQEDPAQPGRKAQWFNDMDTTLRGWPQVKAVAYWDSNDGTCSWFVDSSASSLAAYRAMVNDPALAPGWNSSGITAPSVMDSSIGGVTGNGATLSGSITSGGAATTWHAEYGTTVLYGSQTAETPLAADGPVTTTISGLTPGTTYHARLVATNGGGTVVGVDQVFTTPALAKLGAAIRTKQTAASTASVTTTVTSPGGGTWSIAYGPTPSYGQTVSGSITGSTATPLVVTLTGLLVGQPVHLTLSVTNAGGTVSSGDVTIGMAGLPTLQPLTVAGVFPKSVSLRNALTFNGVSGSYHLEWGAGTNRTTFGPISQTYNVGASHGPVSTGPWIKDLQPKTTYQVRVVATNISGTVYGPVLTFTTS